jgi:hypothetical protein
MPLLDHFRPPLSELRHWDGFHSKWANTLVDDLNERLLPPGYFAEPHIHVGPRVEIDAATFQEERGVESGATATLPAKVYAPRAPSVAMPASFPDTFEVQVVGTAAGPTLVAAIELVSPANKDRPERRRAFALKCASYLCQGIALIVVDVVTDRHANLHDEMVRLLPGGEPYLFPSSSALYAAAYRPVHRPPDGDQIDAWLEGLEVGQALPVMPLFLSAEVGLPIDLEATYQAARRSLRLGGQ